MLINIAESVNVATANITGNRPYELKSGILKFLPPFISPPFIELPDKDPTQLFVNLNAIILSFDQAHTTDNEFASACENSRQLRAFLHWAATDKVSDLTCCTNPDDTELQNYKSKRHQECTLAVINTNEPSAVGNTDAIQQLATSLQNQTDLIEELKVGCEEARDEKKVKFDDLHGLSGCLILNALSQNGGVTPGKASSYCLEFYSKTSAAKASNFLVTTMKDTYKCHPGLQQGLVQALYNGHFLRNREDSPRYFSFFLCPRLQTLASSNR